VGEARAAAGGMTRTEEPALPGFRHNPHANYFSYHEVMPMLADLGLRSRGLRTLMPAAQHGIAFADGGPPIVLHRPGLGERTRRSIGRHSKADADLYVELKRRAAGLGPVLGEGIYRPASKEWLERQLAAAQQTYADIGIGAPIATVPARALIDSLFESDGMRALLYQAAAEFGAPLEEPGSGFAFLTFVLWTTANWCLVLGGMQQLADAFLDACLESGVEVATGAPVASIEVDGGMAAGVVTKEGREFRARHLVASSTDLGHTLLDLVGGGRLGAAAEREIREFDARPASTLGSVMVCLREAPAYSSGRWDPDIDRCFHTMVGFDGPEDTARHLREAGLGLLPTAAGAVRVNSLWDRLQAPPGHQVAAADVFLPPVRSLPEAQWELVRESYDEAFLARWREFAPNMDEANVLADHFHLPPRYDRKVLFKLGSDQYRTPVDGLYVCGAGTFPGGGVHGACGYNAYQAIAEDLGLPPLNAGRRNPASVR
jgi:phytoene dehydrogenase-like protein